MCCFRRSFNALLDARVMTESRSLEHGAPTPDQRGTPNDPGQRPALDRHANPYTMSASVDSAASQALNLDFSESSERLSVQRHQQPNHLAKQASKQDNVTSNRYRSPDRRRGRGIDEPHPYPSLEIVDGKLEPSCQV